MCAPPSPLPAACLRCTIAARQRCGRGLLRLHDYWTAKREGRRFPARRDIDPIELGTLLPHVFLIDVLPEPPYFRYRLTGTTVDEIHGQYLTGKAPRDIRTPEIAIAAESQCRQVLLTGSPGCDHVTLMAQDQSYWHFERLVLPLSDDGTSINMLLCGIYAT
ncbi:MAG: PAS domain-containing protein [Ferrovibrio sp.]|uniref:PAS domain-containing protein n=1 Tax=Ferrovibrio sp. TaxID=1917215 RepID=UPI00260B8EB2|nr:PAS domain-containing protein [Ferrovibrio sp.]MCW0232774.1 PAS domain-containing protein [Ferrovibrio sp.]